MTLEISGQQLRIRLKNPNLFIKDSFRTLDVGELGKLQFVSGQLKSNKQWLRQSVHINLGDYDYDYQAIRDLDRVRKDVGSAHYSKAKGMIKKWFRVV